MAPLGPAQEGRCRRRCQALRSVPGRDSLAKKAGQQASEPDPMHYHQWYTLWKVFPLFPQEAVVSAPPPGWYRDPESVPGTERWWNGVSWNGVSWNGISWSDYCRSITMAAPAVPAVGVSSVSPGQALSASVHGSATFPTRAPRPAACLRYLPASRVPALSVVGS